MPDKPKFYNLMMFPYPSGSAMHVWHASNYLYSEIVARYKRMRGYDVVFPLWYDSFGLPTENFAIKNNKSAWEATEENARYFDEQVQAMDFSLDKDRMLKTSDPEYYKWTQRIFAKLFEHGLVYRKDGLVNRCPSCQTVLANDQVVDGKCERCDSIIEQKQMPQWYIKITDYAEQLLDYSDCDRPEETVTHQKNWIGKSEWAEILFDLSLQDWKSNNEKRTNLERSSITVFTTRPDTLFWATAVVLAPENGIIDTMLSVDKKLELDAFRAEVAKMSSIDRQSAERSKNGIFSGAYVKHPLTENKIPVWFADYVLPDYATGAVMFVPAHDERDYEFAKKYNIEIKEVIWADDFENWICNTWRWVLINSWKFDWIDNFQAKEDIINEIENLWLGNKKITYRLRDWSVSRQRYWGSPIPIYYTFEDNEDGHYTADNPHPDKTKWIPHLILESELPVILPLDLPNYKPAGKSPLEDHPTFKYYHHPDWNTYLRECDTLDTFMCSSFYYLRFLDPNNADYLISPEICRKYMPVDLYIGGKEHTVWHLLYSRFIYKFLKDKWYIIHDSKEPFYKLVHQGMIHAHDGRKMSKRRGNVIDPMDIIQQYDTDTLRTYIMFMWPVELNKNRNPEAVGGVKRFLDRVERAVDLIDEVANKELDSLTQQTVKWVTQDLDALKFNTAISKLMVLTNGIYDYKSVSKTNFETLLLLLSPFASILSKKLWTLIGNDGDVHLQTWPIADDSLIANSNIQLPIQINGKMRWTIDVSADIWQEEVLDIIKQDDRFAKFLSGDIKKVIRVPGKICNIII